MRSWKRSKPIEILVCVACIVIDIDRIQNTYLPKTRLGPPTPSFSNSVLVVKDKLPIAEKTAKPAMNENIEFAIAITHEFTKAGSSRGMWDLMKHIKIV